MKKSDGARNEIHIHMPSRD